MSPDSQPRVIFYAHTQAALNTDTNREQGLGSAQHTEHHNGRTTLYKLPNNHPQRPNTLHQLHTHSRPTTPTKRLTIRNQSPQNIPQTRPRTRPNLRHLHETTSNNRRPLPHRTQRPHPPRTKPQRPTTRTRTLQTLPRQTHRSHKPRRMERTPLTSRNATQTPKQATL